MKVRVNSVIIKENLKYKRKHFPYFLRRTKYEYEYEFYLQKRRNLKQTDGLSEDIEYTFMRCN